MPGPCPLSVWRIQSGSSTSEPEGLELGGNKDPRPHCLSTGRERKHTNTKITHTTPGRRLTLNGLLPQRMLGFVYGQPLPTLGHTAWCTLLPKSHPSPEGKGVTVLTMVGGRGKSSYLAKTSVPAPQPFILCFEEAGAPAAAQASLKLQQPSCLSLLGAGLQVCAHTQLLCVFIIVRAFFNVFHVLTSFCVSSLEVCLQLFYQRSSSPLLGYPRSQVHSGYGSYFTLVVCESFPILELSSLDFPTPPPL